MLFEKKTDLCDDDIKESWPHHICKISHKSRRSRPSDGLSQYSTLYYTIVTVPPASWPQTEAASTSTRTIAKKDSRIVAKESLRDESLANPLFMRRSYI